MGECRTLEVHNSFRKEIVESQNERLKDFSYEKVRETFVSQLKEFIKG